MGARVLAAARDPSPNGRSSPAGALLLFAPSVARQQAAAGERSTLPEETTMDRNFALALFLAAAAAGPAIADDATYGNPPFVSTLSRAEVMADLLQFRQSGVDPWADEYNPLTAQRSERTRADVTREYLDARDAVAAFNGEDSGSAWLARREGRHLRSTELAAR